MSENCAVCALPTVKSSAPLVTYAEEIRIPPSISQPLRDLHLCGACDETKRLLRVRNAPAAKNWRGLSKKTADGDVRAFMNYLLEEYGYQQNEEDELRSAETRRKLAMTKILTTSGNSFEGFSISQYRFVINDEVLVGTAPLRPASGGAAFPEAESANLKKKVETARLAVLENLAGMAVDLDANAIIGLRIDYKMFGESILGVVGIGTAVNIAPVQEA